MFFTQLTDRRHRYFPQALEIYTEAFPADQRQPCSVIEERLNNKLYQWFVGVIQTAVYQPDNTENLNSVANSHESAIAPAEARGKIKSGLDSGQDKVVCIALLYPLENTDFILLDYLATDLAYRSQGIGSQCMQYLEQILAASQKTLIIEVENPDSEEEREQKQRRFQFYRRAGAKLLKNVRYVLPPLAMEGTAEMKLMLFPGNWDYLEGILLKRLVQQIYREVYNRDETDAILNSFIHQIGDRIELI